MFCISVKALAAGLLLVLCGCARHYRAEGVVLAIDRTHNSVTISHRAIPGYMQAMAMPFPVASPGELDGLTPGTRVRFRLRVSRQRASVSRLEVEQLKLDSVRLPPMPQRLQPGQPVPDFALTDQAGRPVRLSDSHGRWVAIDFIYTRCPLPDVCPRLSAHFALLQRRIPALTLLSITVDPVYDTPAVLAGYAQRWQAGPAWRFLTGSPDDIRAVAGRFGLIYWPEEGTMVHTSATALIAPDGTLYALLEGSSYTSRQLTDLVESALKYTEIPKENHR